MNIPSLHRLRVFVAIVDAGGLSAAARSMDLTPSTVSTHLKHLESDLDLALIDRTGPAIRTTAAGETLLGYARTILDQSDQAIDQLKRLGNRPVAGSLAVGGTTTTGEHLLPDLLATYSQRHPDVEIDLTVANTADIIKRVASGDLALGLIAGDADHASLQVDRIGLEAQVVIVSPHHPLAGTEAEPRLLRDVMVLMREPGSSTRRYQQQLFDQWRIPGARISSVTGTGSIIGAVSHGLGISCVPEVCARDALALDRVAEIRLPPRPEDRPIHLIRRHDKPLTMTEDLFLGVITEKELP